MEQKTLEMLCSKAGGKKQCSGKAETGKSKMPEWSVPGLKLLTETDRAKEKNSE